MIYIALYLLAIVLANLTVVWFGPNITIINAFVFIGLDLTTRDKLHDAWHDGLVCKMGGLILAGSAISYLLNQAALRIAIASCASFGISAVIDTIVYQVLRKCPRIVRVNGSNIFSALADSIAFPALAFGGFMPLLTLGQFAAKVFGGLIWFWILRLPSGKLEEDRTFRAAR